MHTSPDKQLSGLKELPLMHCDVMFTTLQRYATDASDMYKLCIGLAVLLLQAKPLRCKSSPPLQAGTLHSLVQLT